MKSVAVVALSVLTFVGGVAGADARGFRLRGSTFSASSRSASSHEATRRRVPAVAAVGTIAPFDPAHAEDATPIPPMPPAPVTLAVEKPVEPWCKSGRIAGQGAGFCLIN